MMLPRVGENFPVSPESRHRDHRARIVAVDTHGEFSWVDDPVIAPTLTVECSCGTRWTADLIEVFA